MIYGYARCSTNETKQDITRQIRELKQKGATDKTIFIEYESGIKQHRTQFEALMQLVNDGDTIIATELSRFTRSTRQLCDILQIVQKKHLKVIIGTFEVDCTTEQLDPMTEGMLKMMCVFAEMERNIICSRIKSGLDNAKSKGIKVGRPNTTADDIPTVFFRHYPKYQKHTINLSELARLCSCSRTTIYKYIKLIDI